MIKQIFIIILMSYLIGNLLNAARLKQPLKLNNLLNCHDTDNVSVPISWDFALSSSGPKIIINGNITITSDLPKQLNVKRLFLVKIFPYLNFFAFQLEIVSNRCQLKAQKCQKESNDTLMSVCKMMTSSNTMTSKVKPKLACPIKK